MDRTRLKNIILLILLLMNAVLLCSLASVRGQERSARERTARELTDAREKTEALRLLCRRYAPNHMDGFDAAMDASLGRTAVWCIAVEEITGKSNRNNHR